MFATLAPLHELLEEVSAISGRFWPFQVHTNNLRAPKHFVRYPSLKLLAATWMKQSSGVTHIDERMKSAI